MLSITIPPAFRDQLTIGTYFGWGEDMMYFVVHRYAVTSLYCSYVSHILNYFAVASSSVV